MLDFVEKMKYHITMQENKYFSQGFFFDNDDFGLGVVNIGLEKCRPNHTYASTRSYFLIHYVVEGRGKLYADNTVYELEKDTAFIIFPNEFTSYSADTNDPWYYYWVGFNGGNIKNIINEECNLTPNNRIIDARENYELKRTLLDMFYNSKKRHFNRYTLTGYMHLFLSLLVKDAPKLSVNVHLNKALIYINENFANDITINDLSKFLFLDRSYVHRLFINKFAISPYAYIKKFRLEKAKYMLKVSNLTVTEIAFYVGFLSLSAFNKAFKKMYNMTPTQYRKSKNLL